MLAPPVTLKPARTMDSIDKFEVLVIEYARNSELELTHLHLQKILYYIQAWGLGYFGTPFFDEIPEAHANGPVYRRVYEKYAGATSSLIVDPAKTQVSKDWNQYVSIMNGLSVTEEQRGLINAVIEKYLGKHPAVLFAQTHLELPWKKARKGLGESLKESPPISRAEMREFYSEIVASNRAKQRAH